MKKFNINEKWRYLALDAFGVAFLYTHKPVLSKKDAGWIYLSIIRTITNIFGLRKRGIDAQDCWSKSQNAGSRLPSLQPHLSSTITHSL